MNTRDLGISGGAGKGDADRTDRAAYVKGLKRVKGLRGLDHKDGFEQVSAKRWRKSYGSKPTVVPGAVEGADGRGAHRAGN